MSPTIHAACANNLPEAGARCRRFTYEVKPSPRNGTVAAPGGDVTIPTLGNSAPLKRGARVIRLSTSTLKRRCDASSPASGDSRDLRQIRCSLYPPSLQGNLFEVWGWN